MTHREAVHATLRREPAEFIPGWTFFSTPQAQEILLPGIAGDTSDDRKISFARATGSSVLDVSGNLQGRVIEEDETHFIVEADNGMRRLVVTQPEWFYETLSRPLDGTYDLDKMHLPDVNSYPEHWDGVAKSVDRFHEEGYFVKGTLDGFYAGIWEHCRRIEEFLLDLAEGSEFADNLVNRWGAFVCDCAGKLLDCGVDAIFWTDDLGSNTGPLISPECYRRFFFPWHKRASDLAHRHGRFAMMHSHGNINKLLPDIVETGINVLDPVGPSDGMDLKHLKETYGDRLSFSGGISRFIADMSIAELRAHLEEVYRIGSKGGGFLPNEEGGVPKNMSKENFEEYLRMRGEMSRRYAGGAKGLGGRINIT